MWINIKEQKPTGIGSAYKCYGTVNKGTEHETRTHFTAYWQGEKYGWTDKCGEDLTGINESVEYWYDFDQVPTPDNNELKGWHKIDNMWRINKELPRNRDFLCRFDDGTICKYSDDHPFAIMTHWKEL